MLHDALEGRVSNGNISSANALLDSEYDTLNFWYHVHGMLGSSCIR